MMALNLTAATLSRREHGFFVMLGSIMKCPESDAQKFFFLFLNYNEG